MIRFLFSIILLAVIVSSFAFVTLKLLANGPEGNFFNEKYRAIFAEQPTVRKILGLHFDGDAKADYLGNRYNKIVIEVDEMVDLDIPSEALDIVETKIEDLTGKDVIIVRSGKIAFTESVNPDNIKSLTDINRNYIYTKDTAKLYVMYLSRLEGVNDSNIGSTNEEYGIIVYDSVIQDLTSGNPAVLSQYIASTILHEFGHQLGLPHNNEKNCLMNDKVEEGDVLRENSGDVIVDFCKYEKDLINQLKSA